MTIVFTAKNAAQKLNSIDIKKQVNSNQPFTWYTCPANKRAIIKGQAVCDDNGSDSSSFLIGASGGANEVRIRTCQDGQTSEEPWHKIIANGIWFDFEIQLEAGETLITDQPTGTNADWTIIAEVEESPA